MSRSRQSSRERGKKPQRSQSEQRLKLQRPNKSFSEFLVETRSLPTLARRYPRDFTFYVTDPISSILQITFRTVFGQSDQLGAVALARARWLQAARKSFISARSTTIRLATPLYFFVIPMTVRLTAPWLTRP